MVWETDGNTGTMREPGSVPDFLDYKERSRTLDMLAGVSGNEVSLSAQGVDPVQVAGLSVTYDLLPMLGVNPIVGSDFYAGGRRGEGTGRCPHQRIALAHDVCSESGHRGSDDSCRTIDRTRSWVSCRTRAISVCCRFSRPPPTVVALRHAANGRASTSGCPTRRIPRRFLVKHIRCS